MSGPNPVYSERSPSSDESAKNQGSAVAYSTSQPQPTTSQSNHDSNEYASINYIHSTKRFSSKFHFLFKN